MESWAEYLGGVLIQWGGAGLHLLIGGHHDGGQLVLLWWQEGSGHLGAEIQNLWRQQEVGLLLEEEWREERRSLKKKRRKGQKM